MSRSIFFDVEEALSREVRRISFFNNRTIDRVVLPDTFDPFTGEVIQTNIEPNFYDSSADASHTQYPHFFIKLLKTREDRFTGRVIPPYGRGISTPVSTSPQAFVIIVQNSDAVITPGNSLQTSLFKIRLVQPGMLLRITTGNNVGTYKVASITISNTGPHTITLSNTLVSNIPLLLFTSATRDLYFNSPIDLNTVKIGDNLVDSTSTSFPITAIDLTKNKVTLGGVGSPNPALGSTITRTGNVLQTTDPSPVSYIIMDPTQPVIKQFAGGDQQTADSQTGISPAIPIDAYYLIRIDSKERETHIEILNRIWEEFNPPRTGLPTIIRNAASAEQLLTADITTGGSQIVNVADNSNFNINDPVLIFDNFHPTKNGDDGFEEPFSAKVIAKIGTNQLQLDSTVPDTYLIANVTKIVSNADFYLHMLNFVDHNVRDNEGAQYWSHEFTLWVQIFVDRLESIADYNGTVQGIAASMAGIQGNVIIDDP